MLSPFSWTETIKMRLQNREKRPLNIVVGWSQKSHCNRGGGAAPLCQDTSGTLPKKVQKIFLADHQVDHPDHAQPAHQHDLDQEEV